MRRICVRKILWVLLLLVGIKILHPSTWTWRFAYVGCIYAKVLCLLYADRTDRMKPWSMPCRSLDTMDIVDGNSAMPLWFSKAWTWCLLRRTWRWITMWDVSGIVANSEAYVVRPSNRVNLYQASCLFLFKPLWLLLFKSIWLLPFRPLWLLLQCEPRWLVFQARVAAYIQASVAVAMQALVVVCFFKPFSYVATDLSHVML